MFAMSRMAPAWASAVSPSQTWVGAIKGTGKGFGPIIKAHLQSNVGDFGSTEMILSESGRV
jgi:hypothetical protein